MPFNLGPVELGLILLIVAMLFGVGKLPEVFGSIGKGVPRVPQGIGLGVRQAKRRRAAGAAARGAGCPTAGWGDARGPSSATVRAAGRRSSSEHQQWQGRLIAG